MCKERERRWMCFIWKICADSDLQKHVTMRSQLEAQELENKNVKDVSIHLYFSIILN